MTKLSDVFAELARNGEKSVSFEFFPPTKARADGAGLDALFYRVAEMGERLRPTFVSLTWRSSFKDEATWLKIGSMVKKQLGIEVLLHLTCHLPREDLVRVLQGARDAGLRNILALRGDAAHFTAPKGSSSVWRSTPNGFKHAVELVHLIRELHGDWFCVGVAGYPEVHTSAWNSEFLPPSEQAREQDLVRLKDKVDAGADFVLTQFFYDVDVFFDFCRRCRELGIGVPILPGYAPIQGFESFQRFRKWVRPTVPAKVESTLARIHGNDELVREYGVELGVEQCGALVRGEAMGVHFFTLNLATSVASILIRLGLREDGALRGGGFGGPGGAQSSAGRELPFRGVIRSQEEIRPIFWNHRHSSYLSRTATWEEFPNGRWGDSRSAATFELADYYLAEKRRGSNVELLKLWGVPQSTQDVSDVFVKYMLGQVKQLPWCDQALALETEAISDSLCWINRHGFLTINSQPKVNGVPSSDERYGWGGPGGFCFQKAYVELFCSPELWHKLKSVMDLRPEFRGRLSYHAINAAGLEFLEEDVEEQAAPPSGGAARPVAAPSATKLRKDSFALELEEELKQSRARRVNAVTWGVFPGREIIQPTVVDTTSFRVWKDEAFELWLTQWAAVYTDSELGGDHDPAAAAAAAAAEPVSASHNPASPPSPDIAAAPAPAPVPATATSPKVARHQSLDEERQNAVNVLKTIHDTWFLVNIVDNDYVSETSDIFDVFKMVILDDMSPEELRSRVDTLEGNNAQLHRELLKARSEINRLSHERQRLLESTTDGKSGKTSGVKDINNGKPAVEPRI